MTLPLLISMATFVGKGRRGCQSGRKRFGGRRGSQKGRSLSVLLRRHFKQAIGGSPPLPSKSRLTRKTGSEIANNLNDWRSLAKKIVYRGETFLDIFISHDAACICCWFRIRPHVSWADCSGQQQQSLSFLPSTPEKPF